MPAPAYRAAPVRVRVPATSANLGPGFDTFGLALGLYDDLVVRVTDHGLHVDIAGEGAASLPRDERHLVVRALRAGFAVLGGQPRGLEVVCANRIPHGRGLGSSAAAIVSGLVAARALVVGGTERLADTGLLGLATRLEGHPDNVAACLLGGFTLAWAPRGRARVLRLMPSPQVVPLLFIPPRELSTEKARGLLPQSVPHADAAANAGRAALFVEALTRRPDLLLDATEDRLHQDYRAPAMPDSHDLVRRLRAASVPAVISGAGPTVLALASASTADPAIRLAGVAADGWRVERPGVAGSGASVLPLEN
jgi:homoserine kinase